MLDGIDGSGKSTVMATWKKYLIDTGNAVFDLGHYGRQIGHYPKIGELKSYDFVISEEPTPLGAGKLVREELMQKGTNYPQVALAQAFSLDRLILYKKIILPLLSEYKCVIQDRGISSIAYQPLYDKKLNYQTISQLPGNALALQHRPDYLILLDTDPNTAIKRLTGRVKNDNNIFEKLTFLKKLRRAYRSSAYQKIFTSRGTKILYLNGNAKIGIMKGEAVQLLKQILTARVPVKHAGFYKK